MTAPDDDPLLPLFHENRAKAIELLLETYHDLVKLFEWNGRPDADDFAQQTFLCAIEKVREGVTIKKTVADYLFGIAFNLIRQDVRQQAKRPLQVEVLPERPDPLDGDALETSVYVQQHLSRFSAEDREVVLRYFTDSRTALQHELRVTENALCVRAFRLKRRLVKSILEEKAASAKPPERKDPRDVTS